MAFIGQGSRKLFQLFLWQSHSIGKRATARKGNIEISMSETVGVQTHTHTQIKQYSCEIRPERTKNRKKIRKKNVEDFPQNSQITKFFVHYFPNYKKRNPNDVI
jgi:hypothetical protein